MMHYKTFTELSEYDQEEARNADAFALGTRQHDSVTPLATARSQASIAAYQKQPASVYVGVTRHCGRWRAQWGKDGKIRGVRQPMTPEGERIAAVERARALGLDYLQRRDGTREAL